MAARAFTSGRIALAALLAVQGLLGAQAQSAAAPPVSSTGPPQCYLYAVDMAYCGSEGLVTDRDTALLVVSCNEAVTGLCAPAINTCITVAGPSNATVQYVNQVVGTSSFYNTFISWDPSYLGPVTVSVNCALTNAAGQSLSAPIQPLTFSVLPIVAVRSSAYRIGGSVMQVAGTAAPEGPSDNPAK